MLCRELQLYIHKLCDIDTRFCLERALGISGGLQHRLDSSYHNQLLKQQLFQKWIHHPMSMSSTWRAIRINDTKCFTLHRVMHPFDSAFSVHFDVLHEGKVITSFITHFCEDLTEICDLSMTNNKTTIVWRQKKTA